MNTQTDLFQPVSESNHDDLLAVLRPLIEYMDNHQYHYFLVAGKDETCSRYLRGSKDDIRGMIEGFVEANPQLEGFLKLDN